MIDARLPELDGDEPDRGAIAQATMKLAVAVLDAPDADIDAAAFAWAAHLPATLGKGEPRPRR